MLHTKWRTVIVDIFKMLPSDEQTALRLEHVKGSKIKSFKTIGRYEQTLANAKQHFREIALEEFGVQKLDDLQFSSSTEGVDAEELLCK